MEKQWETANPKHHRHFHAAIHFFDSCCCPSFPPFRRALLLLRRHTKIWPTARCELCVCLIALIYTLFFYYSDHFYCRVREREWWIRNGFFIFVLLSVHNYNLRWFIQIGMANCEISFFFFALFAFEHASFHASFNASFDEWGKMEFMVCLWLCVCVDCGRCSGQVE